VPGEVLVARPGGWQSLREWKTCGEWENANAVVGYIESTRLEPGG
jgi:hypothetical protein